MSNDNNSSDNNNKNDKKVGWSDYSKLGDWLPTIIVGVAYTTLMWSLHGQDEKIYANRWAIPIIIASIFWGWYKGQDRRRKSVENGELDYKVFLIRFWFYLFMMFVPWLALNLFGILLRLDEFLVGFSGVLHAGFVMFGMQIIAKKLFPYSYDKKKEKN